MRIPDRPLLCAALACALAVGAAAQTRIVAVGAGVYAVRDARGDAAQFTVPAVAGQLPAVSMRAEPDDWQRVTLKWRLTRQVQQDDLSVVFDLLMQPDFRWLPHLAPVPGTLVPEMAFRSPAWIVAEGARTLAVVPDLRFAGLDADAPLYLDYDEPARRAWFGKSRNSLLGHVLFRREPWMVLAPGELTIGFLLRLADDPGPVLDPFAAVARLHWRRHASPEIAHGAPGVGPFEPQVEQAYEWLDRYPGLAWHEFDLGGRRVGGAQKLVDLTWTAGWTGPPLPRRFEIWNQAWFSSVRTGAGLVTWGRRMDRPDWVAKGQASKRLALSAPQRDGLFPAVFAAAGPAGGRTTAPTRADWEAGSWTGSTHVPTEQGIDRSHYHLADSSTTALWLLRWHRDLEPDPEILRYLAPYAKRLLALQRPDGFFPAWVDPVTLRPTGFFEATVESSVSATFLLEFAEVVGAPACRAAALRALTAVIAGPVPAGQWEDFETWWSDNDIGRPVLVGQRFPRNAMFKQNTLGMFWTAEALLRAHRATGQQAWLDWGLRVLDELSLWQQVWQPPEFPVPTVGGFGVMNADSEWNDARQSLFAELYLDYYLVTGREELFERGVAALRCGFSLGFGPWNPRLDAAWSARFPFMVARDHGFANENHAHFGVAGPTGGGLVFFTIFDWCGGASAAAAARITERFGQVYVDRRRGHALGIDGVRASLWGGELDLRDVADPSPEPRKVDVRYADGSHDRVELPRR